jgi:hypothetical protein
MSIVTGHNYICDGSTMGEAYCTIWRNNTMVHKAGHLKFP